MSAGQLPLPGVPLPSGCGPCRRRAFELAELLIRAERRIRMLVRDLAEVRAIVEGLRRDMSDLEAERDRLARALLGAGLRLQVTDAGPLPRGPGVSGPRSESNRYAVIDGRKRR